MNIYYIISIFNIVVKRHKQLVDMSSIEVFYYYYYYYYYNYYYYYSILTVFILLLAKNQRKSVHLYTVVWKFHIL